MEKEVQSLSPFFYIVMLVFFVLWVLIFTITDIYEIYNFGFLEIPIFGFIVLPAVSIIGWSIYKKENKRRRFFYSLLLTLYSIVAYIIGNVTFNYISHII